MSILEIAFVSEIFTTFALFGLIWTIQIVHYPSFHFVETAKFKDFEAFHSKRISIIVIPLMMTELVVSIAMLFLRQGTASYANFGIVLLVWLSTFLLSVPRHNKLIKGKDDQVISELILTNWPRTILWSLKSIIVFKLLLV